MNAGAPKPKKALEADDQNWHSKFDNLVEYAKRNGGDYNVPRTYSFVDDDGVEINLGWWLYNQRNEKRKGMKRFNALMHHFLCICFI